ncbi:MAG: TraR/DksA C4-type zinc finger protein [Actinomycetota bacterium]|nr:TraR/DksA C4-type zinc finger protein [Actinomycetota bacterium]
MQQSEAALADIRASLEEERGKLVERLAELGFGDPGSLAFDQNFADSSQVTAERAEVEALATSLKDSLDEVETALSKLETGTFGNCEGCGQPISVARLEAKPAARYCIDCASRR